jgi:hypothetical protein
MPWMPPGIEVRRKREQTRISVNAYVTIPVTLEFGGEADSS